MRNTFISALAVAAAIAASACAGGSPAPADTTADKAAIDKLRSEYAAAYSAGDLDKVASLYANDIILMETGHPPAMGKEAVLAQIKSNMSQATLTLSIIGEETKITGDTAYDRGSYMLTIAPKAPDAPQMMEHGKYLVIATKQADGSWKLTREIGNSNDPMPPPPPAPAAAAKPGAKTK